jgi:hypothetical protein
MSPAAAKTKEATEQTTETKAIFRIQSSIKYLANTPGDRAVLQFAVRPLLTMEVIPRGVYYH